MFLPLIPSNVSVCVASSSFTGTLVGIVAPGLTSAALMRETAAEWAAWVAVESRDAMVLVVTEEEVRAGKEGRASGLYSTGRVLVQTLRQCHLHPSRDVMEERCHACQAAGHKWSQSSRPRYVLVRYARRLVLMDKYPVLLLRHISAQ